MATGRHWVYQKFTVLYIRDMQCIYTTQLNMDDSFDSVKEIKATKYNILISCLTKHMGKRMIE